MKNLAIISILAVLALAARTAQAGTTYNDATGDFTGGNSDLDLSSVMVNNDASTLTFTINLAGNPSSGANWYEYYIGISEDLFSGVGGNLNDTGGWGKDIQMSSGGMDYFIGSYPYYSGYDLLTWDGSAWTTTKGTASQDTSSVTLSVNLSDLGLAAGNNFKFDVWSSDSGSDTVLDALSDNTSRSWNSSAFDTGANALTYTVEAVPEPRTYALLVLGVLLVSQRLFGRKL